MSGEPKPIRGTREWAVASINCCTGCPHNCRYCYARYDALQKGPASYQQWTITTVRPEDVEAAHPLYPGQVMFPTRHDIVEENLEACIRTLCNLLEVGNRVLVVTKPSLSCIKALCNSLARFREQILFRFTITARNMKLLSYWEPGAPSYKERLESLKYCHEQGYDTSVSVEPMLDTGDVVAMVKELLPWVSHSIWLGKMNKIDQRVELANELDRIQVETIRAGQSEEKIRFIYQQLRHEPRLRWKESIKQVVGLPLASKPGEDL